jgi:hypothetical protein
MGSSPSKPKRSIRPPQSASSQANAEISRRSSLRNQRSQIDVLQKAANDRYKFECQSRPQNS